MRMLWSHVLYNLISGHHPEDNTTRLSTNRLTFEAYVRNMFIKF